MSKDSNPYYAPGQFSSPPLKASPKKPLADLGKRFLGALVDAFVGFLFVIPGYAIALITIASAGHQQEPPTIAFVGFGIAALGGITNLVLQIYLLATRSQSVGKFVMKTQIVDVNTGQPAGLLNTLVLRLLVNGVIAAIPCIGAIYAIVDICFIFREDRRCIHDLIANTVVVDIS